MCGVFGVSGDLDQGAREKFEKLGKLSMERGKNAAGIIIAVPGKFRLCKAPVPFNTLRKSKAYRKTMQDWTKARFAVGHTRRASFGSPKDNRNNHPIATGHSLGVHNGIIWNYEHIPVDRQFDVDSEVLFRLLDEFGPEKFGEISNWMIGNAAFAWVSRYDGSRLWLGRCRTPLWVAEEKGRIWFASQSAYLYRVGLHPRQLAEGKLYFLSGDQLHQSGIGFALEQVRLCRDPKTRRVTGWEGCGV